MIISMTLTPSPRLARAFTELGRLAPPAVATALQREAETIMRDSKSRVPVDTGALRASGQVQPPEVTPTGASVTLGYGNAAVGYAVFVHENVTAQHRVGESKFLERPLHEARAGMPNRLAADIRRILSRWGV